MQWLQTLLSRDAEARELYQSSSRKIIWTVAGVYLVWHMLATLFWTELFSPDLWLCTVVMIIIVWGALRLLPRSYVLAQAVWFTGLSLTVLIAYNLFHRPEIALVLAFLPMMAFAMMGLRGALGVELLIVLIATAWNTLPWMAPLPAGYQTGVAIASLAATALGWGIADNLISANEASSFHYHEALERLEEARRHRAEVSSLLKELGKSNYQLDRLNRMLSAARSRAEEAREERDRFALAVSHELRSPMNFIIGFSDLMVNSPETYGPLETWPPGLYDDVQEIYRSSTHLHGLINDILEMGKIDAQQMVLFREKTNLGELMEDIRRMLVGAVEKKGLALELQVEPDLPEIYADRTRIRQVMINLVTNALHFTATGKITIRVLRQDARFLRVEVEDTGSGIAPEDLPKLFREFRQVGSQNWRRDEGTGLGLSIGRRFIQLHNGEMGVESELGRGSTFHFTLPVEEINVEELKTPEVLLDETARMPLRESPEEQPLVLFLSVDPFWARIFSEALDGYKITLLSDPNQLFTAAAQYYPRAILVDQAVQQHPLVQNFLHRPPYDVPVIFLTTPVNLNRVTSLPDGVRNYLVKPVSRQTLTETVQALGDTVTTLLVVDDDPGMVRFVTQVLRSEETDPLKYRFVTAFNGHEAMQQLGQQVIDAVLLDLDLPDMNGFSVLESMQQDPSLKKIPVIIVSANDLPQSLVNQRKGDFQVLLNRPFSRRELAEMLKGVLEHAVPDYSRSSPVEGESISRSSEA
jgi:signal transduction histidine kinase/CheY-like chemotaxis protein